MKLSRTAIGLLSLISGFLPLVTDGFLGAIRPLMVEFQVPLAAAQGAITAAFLGCACTQLLVGAVADRYGRRPVLTAAIGLFIAASIGVGLSPSLHGVLLFRFLQGACAGAGPLLARAIIRDIYDRQRGAHLLSIVSTGIALVAILVPALNSFIVLYCGWRAITAVYVAVLLLALLLTRAVLPETLRAEHRTPLQFRSLLLTTRAVCANRRVLGSILCCVTGFAGLAVWVSASPHLLLQWFGRPVPSFGVYWGITIIAYLVGGWASVALLRYRACDRILALGSTLLVIAALLLITGYVLAPHSLTLFLIGICLYTFSWSMLQPNAQMIALTPFRASAGRVSAILGFVQLTGGALMAQLFGWLHDGTPLIAIALITAAALGNAIVRRLLCPSHPDLAAENSV